MPSPAPEPLNIQVIGTELAIAWNDGAESYLSAEDLRAASPSAETQGERDILGQRHGGGGPRKFPDVMISGWEPVGNYAIRIDFSDGHRTGIYSWEYLRSLAGLGTP